MLAALGIRAHNVPPHRGQSWRDRVLEAEGRHPGDHMATPIPSISKRGDNLRPR